METEEPAAKKPGRGGRRPGAGRKPKNRNALPDLDIQHALAQPVPDQIENAAQPHALRAIASLVKLLVSGENETAAVSAANTILDRGYGKPAVDIGGFDQLPLFGGVSVKGAIAREIRDEARKYANLAIERLRRIADSGRSESARHAAAKSLLERGLGTVAVARIDLETPRAVGKKEQAAMAAAAPAAEESGWGDDLTPRMH